MSAARWSCMIRRSPFGRTWRTGPAGAFAVAAALTELVLLADGAGAGDPLLVVLVVAQPAAAMASPAMSMPNARLMACDIRTGRAVTASSRSEQAPVPRAGSTPCRACRGLGG